MDATQNDTREHPTDPSELDWYATQNDPREHSTDPSELEWWLRTCDNHGCNQVVTRPMGTTCGHLFCSPCLVARGVTPLALSCPLCNAALTEEAIENMATTRSPAVLLNHVPTRMRIEFYRKVIKKWRELNGENRVQLLRNLSEVRGRRIEQLERGMDSMTGLNSDLLTEIDLRDTTINDMRTHTEQLDRRGAFTTSVKTELMREMMNMRREMSARIAQSENDAASRASTAPEPETNGP